MTVKKFQELFPLISKQVTAVNQGVPHEGYARVNDCRARLACGKLFGRKILIFPFEIAFYTVFNVILLIGKIGELIWRLFALCKPTALKKEKFKKVALQLWDLTMLFSLYTILQLTKIVRLALATFFNPRLYFKPPEKAILPLQEKYYHKWTNNVFEQLFSYQEFDLKTKASVHEIKSAFTYIEERLKDMKERIKFLSEVYDLVKKLRLEISKAKLIELRELLEKWDQEKKFEMSKIRLPLVDEEL